jgi:transcriptional regulator of arginine metabolism
MAPLPKDDRSVRRKALREILEGRAVSSQTQVVEALAARGIAATQSSVSRDLREMGVAKTDGRYVLDDSTMRINIDAHDAAFAVAAALVRDVRLVPPNLVVVKTTPGGASAARAVDAAGDGDVAGTVAGDDTIFVAVRGRAGGVRFEARLRDALLRARPENAVG